MLETLMALSMLTTLLVISLPLSDRILEKVEEEQFFKLFSSDILFMQKATTVSQTPYRLMIYPESNTYEIRKGGFGEVVIRRSYSKSIIIDTASFQFPFSFYPSGTPQSPGSFYVYTRNQGYKITFPFGKGRFYVTKIK
ncbi:MAG: hypothetical protein H0Z32_06610 [Bacillaceae bacterium]|nr:hypothetical protein [Bacillaceae bacterium]